ncbi:class I adenylate cyclase [Aliagarivorans marinus]|uniref:class I adenylate cyclase n=1 Tax=Aliagarivorans marinus TaxID=561965 RepID=UPI00041A74F1|nr:class I adenylate cyclase [Aliagarivorans marinus]
MQETIAALLDKARRTQQHRKQLALQTMSAEVQQVFELLPSMLHYHHPSIPGFVDGEVPQGICRFEPTTRHSIFLQQHFLCTPEQPQSREILGIYSMGSTATIGQSQTSDLDIWVCHDAEMDAERVELLRSKCDKISVWADHQGVELNFFMVAENQFKTGAISELSKDNCGSAQHLLLLDEFYRTALPLAGKKLVWYAVPAELDQSYDSFVAEQFAAGHFNHERWLDLGGLDVIPAEEYFGSALWQLYKGIDSPYKAVLKTLLMEAYSSEYPNTALLAVEAKRIAQEGREFELTQDAYYLMLAKVTDYLESIEDYPRLDLVRRCFYLKNSDNNPLPSDLLEVRALNWQQRFMAKLVKQWGWSQKKIEHLNQRSSWKVKDVKEAHAELLDALMLSYRNLIRFARRNNISESINPEDIGILSRKLYAAFESLPGKVTQINPQISPDLSEPHLSFIHSPAGSQCGEGWYLYRAPLDGHALRGHVALEHSSYLAKLVSWGYFNELSTNQTQLHVYQREGAMCEQKVLEFDRDLRRAFPVHIEAASNLALTRPCEIRHLGVFINLEQDPTARWAGKVIEFDGNATNIFSFGRSETCLVASVDLVYRNTWNEIRTLHFSGDTAVVDALTTVLGKMHRDAKKPEHIDVFCYSAHFREEICSNFQALLEECIESRLKARQQKAVKTVLLGKEKYGLFIEDRGVSVKKLDNSVRFYSELSNNKLERMPLQLNTGDKKTVPNVVEAHASEGLVQYFFENLADGFNIYIVDETNQIEMYHEFAGSKDELVQGINRFYTTSSREQVGGSGNSQAINFNLPQFYDIVVREGHWQVEPFRSGEGR